MSALFAPLTIRSLTVRNRTGVAPFSLYAANQDGSLSDWHLVHLAARAAGGAGLVFAEPVAVTSEGRGTPHCAGLWKDSQITPLARVAKEIERHGAVLGIQLAHAGRRGSRSRPWEGGHHLMPSEGGWETVAAWSRAIGGPLWKIPRQLMPDEIRGMALAFADAAVRAAEAGARWLELNYADGYLHNCFLSPLVNRRGDEFGGSFENRVRFHIETARAVRRVWPQHLPLSVQLTAPAAGGDPVQLDDLLELARRLAGCGVDLIGVGSGYVTPDPPDPEGAFMVPLSRRLGRGCGSSSATVWAGCDPHEAQAMILTGDTDLVLLSREVVLKPHWPYAAAQCLNVPDADSLLPAAYLHGLDRCEPGTGLDGPAGIGVCCRG